MLHRVFRHLFPALNSHILKMTATGNSCNTMADNTRHGRVSAENRKAFSTNVE